MTIAPSPPPIRDAVDADLPSITAIYDDAVRHGAGSFELEPPSLAEMTGRWQEVVAAGLPWLVALQGERVAGYAYAGPYRPRPGYAATLGSSVYVAAAARGGGIGRALLAELLHRATAGGYRQMVATIGDSANHASIRLHAGAGFRHVGTLEGVGRKHGRWLDTVIMQRALGPGAETPPE